MHVVHITPEMAPYSKTGGLGDVAAALPRALAQQGLQVTVVTPRYASVDPQRFSLARRLRTLQVPVGRDVLEVGLYEGTQPGAPVRVVMLDHAPSFGRAGLYGEAGADYPDNWRRFALLARGALDALRELGLWPDVIHAHDWQSGLVPFMVRRGWLPGVPPAGLVFTIHNLAFQGLFPERVVDELGLGRDVYHPEGIEYYGNVSYLKAGILYSDRVTTVSPRYAREIQTPELGFGFDGLLAAHRHKLFGVLNGCDYDVWDPRRDPQIATAYGPDDPAGKAECKAALQREMGLPVRPRVPLLGSISRLTEQKGFDLVAEIAEDLAQLDLQYVILGSGERPIETRLVEVARRHPDRFAVRIAYDDGLAHRIEAGADLFVMPSRFEPCGLNQMYGLRYGSLPVVRATGGLDDTVVDYDPKTRSGNGFKFLEYSGSALLAAVRRALAACGREPWSQIVRQAMLQDFSWRTPARHYAEIYESAAAEARAR